MLSVVKDQKEITAVQRRFERLLVTRADQTTKAVIGHQGDTISNSTIHIFRSHQFWACIEPLDTRYWNAFGTTMPEEVKTLSLVVEVNTPLRGINRLVKGAFLKDSGGRYFLGHRGGINRVPMAVFWDHYSGKRAVVDDGGRETEVALVSALDSPHLVRHIGFFVHEVEQIKRLVASGSRQLKPSSPLKIWDEFEGKKRYRTASEVEAQCDHGRIVRGLRVALEQRRYRVAKTVRIDLCTLDNSNAMSILFEVKTDLSLTSIYTAIGQLVLHASGQPKAPRRVLVLPAGLRASIRDVLCDNDFDVLEFRWKGDEPYFPGLEALLAQAKT